MEVTNHVFVPFYPYVIHGCYDSSPFPWYFAYFFQYLSSLLERTSSFKYQLSSCHWTNFQLLLMCRTFIFLSPIRLVILLPILSHQSVASVFSHNGLLSPFPSYSPMFYSFPSSSFFSWSMHAGPTYINSVVTICILHSRSTQYKHISSLIPQAILTPLEASHFTTCLKSL